MELCEVDAARLRLAEEVFQRIVDADEPSRASILDEGCGGDAELRAFVEGLLEYHEAGMGKFLQQPVVGSQFGDMQGISAQLPERIGRYEVLRKLGEGGMSIVYEAQQDRPHRTVALKVIRPGIASESLLRRFQFEAELLGRLQHPGIASIHDAGVADVFTPGQATSRQPFFAMELIRGRPLDEFTNQHDLSVRDRLELFIKTCEAVQYAHARGVVHRDLKPANVLVDADHQPKVLDFGVARLTDADVQSTTMHTEIGQWIGTLPYMSPEQVGGDSREVDFRADIYALGVILYELLAGRLPYDVTGRTLPEAARIIREEDPTRLGGVHTRFRGDLETIVAKALEKDKTRRYPSAAELAADVHRYLRDEPITARRPSAIYQLRKLAVRHKTLSVSLAILFLVLGGFGIWMSLLYQQADRLRLAADQQARRARQTQVFLEKMLSSIDPEVARGKDTSIIRGILSEAAEKAGTELATQPEAEADIRATIGVAYLRVGLTGEAQAQLEAALNIRRRRLGEEHDAVAETLRHLAQCAGELGDRERAEDFGRQSLALRRQLFGSSDLKVAESLQTLAWILSELHGNRPEAASLLRESLEITERLSGREHPLYANGLHSLAVVLWRWARYPEAEPVARETLDLKRQLYGTEHSSVATAMDLLGQVLTHQSKVAEAEPLLRESLEMHRRLFGEDHPVFATSLASLAELYVRKKDYATAEQVARQCHELVARLRGENSHETAFSWMNLAALLDKKGDTDEAQELYRVADERFRKVFPPDHPYVHSPLTRLAEMLDRIGKHEEAEPLWRQLRDETGQAFPSGHTHRPIALAKPCALGRCLFHLRRCQDAEQSLLECYEGQGAGQGAHHKDTIRAVKDLVRLYEECGPPEKAQEFRATLESSQTNSPEGSREANAGK